ncbi:MAG: hypothetical protein IJS50_05360 [Desulfovibrio sp.]|nr:hypothetical protein [Desulfovibrio sp.]
MSSAEATMAEQIKTRFRQKISSILAIMDIISIFLKYTNKINKKINNKINKKNTIKVFILCIKIYSFINQGTVTKYCWQVQLPTLGPSFRALPNKATKFRIWDAPNSLRVTSWELAPLRPHF